MQGTSKAGVPRKFWVSTLELVFFSIIATLDKVDVMMHEIERSHPLVDFNSN